MNKASTFSCKCGEVFMKALETTGGLHIRGKVLLVKDSQLVSVCKSCGAENVLPVDIKMKNPKLLIKK